MQIGENVYLNIKVINAKNEEQYLSFDNMKEFILVETAGTSLPYVCFSFWTTNKKLIELFIENNKVEVSLGNTVQDAETFKMTLFQTPKNTDPSDNTATISAAGFLADNAFMVNRGECKAYKGNSLMVLQQVLQNFEGINKVIASDFTKVKENQVTWRQLYETASSFLVRVLLHMDVRPSFPLFSFDKYGKFHVKDYEKVIKEGPVARFTPFEPINAGDIQYLNNFNVESFKPSYNLYSGYNKITEIYGIEAGIPGYNLAENTPLIASTKEAEKSKSGNRISLNKSQSANVHRTYMASFAHNTNKLVSLSALQGVLQLRGYHPNLKPTDLVYVETPKENGMISSFEGLYFIDTIVTSPNFREGIVTTYVYVTRDNNNNIENFVTPKPQTVNLTVDLLNTLMDAVSATRTSLATCSQIIDSVFINTTTSYVSNLKMSLLRMFSIENSAYDYSVQLSEIQNFLQMGNTIMNVLMSMLFPREVFNILKDFLITKPSTKTLVDRYITQYVPMEVQGLITTLVNSLTTVGTTLNSIAKDNGVTTKEVSQVSTKVEYAEEENSYNEKRVEDIIQNFENNTTGLDIPFPMISLTESQKLLPDKELEEFIASETVANLTDLGYMKGLSGAEVNEFKQILMGEIPISYSIISKINEAVGDTLNYRFWGTYGPKNEPLYAWKFNDELVYTKTLEILQYTGLFNEDYTPYTGGNFVIAKNSLSNSYEVFYIISEDNTGIAERSEEDDVTTDALSQLTDFYIGKGFKDRYKTLPCTKMISASKNARLYFACPQSEKNVKFYINSRRMELDRFPIELGYTDAYGNPVPYFVYYTTTGYNSNSTMLEVRQG